MSVEKYRKSAEKRFWSKVVKSLGCWEYIGNIKEGKYGTIGVGGKYNNKNVYAHRLSFFLSNGFLPDDLSVCHKCDNPKCVNPDHLFLGTTQDNVNDMVKKGRQTFGSRNPRAILSDSKIIEIINLWNNNETIKDISLKFNTSRANVCTIINRNSWKHLNIKVTKPLAGRYKFPKGEDSLVLRLKSDMRNELISKYLEGVSGRILCEEYNIGMTTLNRYWRWYRNGNKIVRFHHKCPLTEGQIDEIISKKRSGSINICKLSRELNITSAILYNAIKRRELTSENF